jgi:ATP-dependent DNA helicase RecG
MGPPSWELRRGKREYEQIGSGVYNVSKYLPIYSRGATPKFDEQADMFVTTSPLVPETARQTGDQGMGEVTPQVTPQVTPEVEAPVMAPVEAPVEAPIRRLLEFLSGHGEASNAEILKAFTLKSRRRMREAYITPALRDSLIERSIPDKPQSSKQKYRLTDKGREIMRKHAGGTP